MRVFRTGFGLSQGAGGRAGVKVKAAGVGGDEGLSWAERGEQMPRGKRGVQGSVMESVPFAIAWFNGKDHELHTAACTDMN